MRRACQASNLIGERTRRTAHDSGQNEDDNYADDDSWAEEPWCALLDETEALRAAVPAAIGAAS